MNSLIKMMKKISILILILFFTAPAFGQSGDEVTGLWYSEHAATVLTLESDFTGNRYLSGHPMPIIWKRNKENKIEIYAVTKTFYGRRIDRVIGLTTIAEHDRDRGILILTPATRKLSKGERETLKYRTLKQITRHLPNEKLINLLYDAKKRNKAIARNAAFELSGIFTEGKGVNKSKEDAIKWMKKAAEKGHRRGQYELGLLLLKEPKAKDEALKWIKTAANAGVADAITWLKKNGNTGLPGSSHERSLTKREEFDPWFLEAVRKGNIEETADMLKKGMNANSTNIFGRTILSVAIVNGQFETARLLIENGANVNMKSVDKWSRGSFPLQQAIWKKSAPMVGLLLENGAKVNINDRNGNSLLESAWDNEEICRMLIEKGANVAPARRSNYRTNRRHVNLTLKHHEILPPGIYISMGQIDELDYPFELPFKADLKKGKSYIIYENGKIRPIELYKAGFDIKSTKGKRVAYVHHLNTHIPAKSECCILLIDFSGKLDKATNMKLEDNMPPYVEDHINKYFLPGFSRALGLKIELSSIKSLGQGKIKGEERSRVFADFMLAGSKEEISSVLKEAGKYWTGDSVELKLDDDFIKNSSENKLDFFYRDNANVMLNFIMDITKSGIIIYKKSTYDNSTFFNGSRSYSYIETFYDFDKDGLADIIKFDYGREDDTTGEKTESLFVIRNDKVMELYSRNANWADL